MIKILRRWLEESDPDTVIGELPSKIIALDDDCEMKFKLIPRSPEFRKEPAQIIGSPPSGYHWGDASVAITRTLEKKAKRYGQLDAPLVIALNILPWYHNARDVRGILFSSHKGRKSKNHSDAFWGEADTPHNRKVSAVIATGPLVVSTLHIQKPVVHHNPWAFHPVDRSAFLLEQAIYEERGETKTIHPSKQLRDLIGLPENWPFSHEPE